MTTAAAGTSEDLVNNPNNSITSPSGKRKHLFRLPYRHYQFVKTPSQNENENETNETDIQETKTFKQKAKSASSSGSDSAVAGSEIPSTVASEITRLDEVREQQTGPYDSGKTRTEISNESPTVARMPITTDTNDNETTTQRDDQQSRMRNLTENLEEETRSTTSSRRSSKSHSSRRSSSSAASASLSHYSRRHHHGRFRLFTKLACAVDDMMSSKTKLITESTPSSTVAGTPESTNLSEVSDMSTSKSKTSLSRRKLKLKTPKPPPPQPRMRLNEGVYLYGTDNEDDHKQRVEEMLERCKDLYGKDGLLLAGFEYRLLPCQDHATNTIPSQTSSNSSFDNENGVMSDVDLSSVDKEEKTSDRATMTALLAQAIDCSSINSDTPTPAGMKNDTDGDNGNLETTSLDNNIPASPDDTTFTKECLSPIESSIDATTTETTTVQEHDDKDDKDDKEVPSMTEQQESSTTKNTPKCPNCHLRLYHHPSNTLITTENRRVYISDGRLFDEIARLCQEVAQTVMQEEGDLEWVTICDQGENPIRALIHNDHHLVSPLVGEGGHDSDSDSDHHDPKPTLLITTGKGKVMAGIFSRQHLMTSGIETSTALPMVREAMQRNMNIAILDPNARGERMGMVTYEKSLGVLFGHWEDDTHDYHHRKHDLYVLAHSASGAQLVRYLLDRCEYYLPRIRAIAFTDSTHSIQWTRNDANLKNLLESSACVYVKSANQNRDTDWERHKPGDDVETDSFWKHRFGSVKTMWAGTHEHSLTNWFAHSHIWGHFDRHLRAGGGNFDLYWPTQEGASVSSHDENSISDGNNSIPQQLEIGQTTAAATKHCGVPLGAVTL
eukprot:CAMPEP_0195287890 /NCGR_PEP_ID=MMETSP0707-20130614/4773_1 /TAXON_ID=33640 /ORGANISM="Asterionellopsis glacialis, Strain CCMP134" /LENGTH=838 /DNA_ID=CAMNT_0040347695 /DNA_START=28 /DNA_END=2544 /DNA_ORIENTATION=+